MVKLNFNDSPCPSSGFCRESHCYDSMYLYGKLMHRFNITEHKHKTQKNCVISTRPTMLSFGTNVNTFSSDEEYKGHFFMMQEFKRNVKTKQNKQLENTHSLYKVSLTMYFPVSRQILKKK